MQAMAKGPEEMAQAMIDNMPEKTGKGLTEWLEIVKKSSLAKHGEIVKHLKGEHGMTHGYANLVAHEALSAEASTPKAPTDLVDTQYSGAKAGLRPIYDSLIQAVSTFGEDLEISPKKTYVSLRRNKQFAIIKPSTRTRIDVGINLKGEETCDRLAAGKSFSGMVSHQVAVTDVADVDRELVGWLKEAYRRG
jgi:predicted transport protein